MDGFVTYTGSFNPDMRVHACIDLDERHTYKCLRDQHVFIQDKL